MSAHSLRQWLEQLHGEWRGRRLGVGDRYYFYVEDEASQLSCNLQLVTAKASDKVTGLVYLRKLRDVDRLKLVDQLLQLLQEGAHVLRLRR